ncbi:hypothetical protein HK100_010150 [Physocladia obscura]|uniref:Fibronectin type-III domain-containing protein n=1 Tax=Physocladia obscura TaxID=109957 RepID=A0AAD5T2L7_9FUNG|nr:hypothetical protein HK100_010150 [Physocladia obscura]
MGNIIFIFITALRFVLFDISPVTNWDSFSFFFADNIYLQQSLATDIPLLPSATVVKAPSEYFRVVFTSVIGYILQPLAIHCCSSALVFIFWSLTASLVRNADVVYKFFGCIKPVAPRIAIEEVGGSRIRISWAVTHGGTDIGNKGKKRRVIAGNSARMNMDESILFSANKIKQIRVYSSQDGETASGKDKEGNESKDPPVIAPTRKFLVELDGAIVGETGKVETCVDLKGLQGNTVYNIRVWAVAAKNMKSASKMVRVKTLPSKVDMLDTLHKSTSVQTVEISPAELESKDKNEDTIDCVRSKEKLAKEAQKADEQVKLAELEEEIRANAEIERLQAAIEAIHTLQAEFEKTAQNTADEHIFRMQAMENELAKLRAERKATEPKRLAMKLELKRLEEMKRSSESKRNKVEISLSLAKAELEHTKQETINCEKEIEELKGDIKRTEIKAKQEEVSFEKKRTELENATSTLKEELKALNILRTKAKKTEENVRNQIRIKEAVIEGIEKETLLIGKQNYGRDDFEERDRALTEDLKIWQEIHDKLQSEHGRFKTELKEEKRVKEVLLQELSRAKSRLSRATAIFHSQNNNNALPKSKIRLLQPQPTFLENSGQNVPQIQTQLQKAQVIQSQQSRSLLDFKPTNIHHIPSFDLTTPHLLPNSTIGANLTSPLVSQQHSPKEPQGLFVPYLQAPAYISSCSSSPVTNYISSSSRTNDDDIEVAVANSLMGEINAYTV